LPPCTLLCAAFYYLLCTPCQIPRCCSERMTDAPPSPTLCGLCASAWLNCVFSRNLLQSSLCSINAGQTTPTTPQDVGDADGKERTRDRPHEVHPVAGKVPQ